MIKYWIKSKPICKKLVVASIGDVERESLEMVWTCAIESDGSTN